MAFLLCFIISTSSKRLDLASEHGEVWKHSDGVDALLHGHLHGRDTARDLYRLEDDTMVMTG